MRGRIPLSVFLLAACGATAESPVKPTPSPVAAPTGPRDEARVAVAIGGRLRGHDGEALRAAEFVVLRNDFSEPTAKGKLAEDGSFRVEVEPGLYMLSVAAVDHAQVVQPLLVEGVVEVQGTLGTYAREDPGATLRLKAELLAADGERIATGPDTAARAADGSYRVDLRDRPKEAVKLRYQLVGNSGRTYNGPLADTHENDGGGDFWSVVAIEGRDELALDLAALPPAGKAAQLTWSGESPGIAALRAYRERWSVRVEQLSASMPRKDGKIVEPTPEQRAEVAALATEALAEADAATSDDARMLLRLAHLDVFAGHEDQAATRTRAEWLVERVDPQDLRLGLFWNLENVLARALDPADEALTARVEAWLARSQANPNPATALGAISLLIHRADERGDDARVAELYAAVREPRFTGTYTAKYLAQRFDPDRILQRGRPFPGFEFPALAAGGRPITRAERAGRLYFIEFWATWCGPCVADMPDLHAAYAQVNGARPGKGEGEAGLRRLGSIERPKIEFVFVSLDQRPEDVRAFRAEHWSMPWTHAFVGRDGEKEVMERYGFSGVPTGVLVDGAGTIIEVGAALRRERLLPTLERALASAR